MPGRHTYFFRHRGDSYSTLKYLLELHEDALKDAGGASRINHQSVIKSATRKAVESAGGEDAYLTLFWKVAAMGLTLAHDHGFRDGNKRTAVLAMFATLEQNGHYPNPANDSVKVVIVLTAMGLLNIEDCGWALLMWCGLEAGDQSS